MKKFFANCSYAPPVSLAVIISFGFGIFQAFSTNSGEWDSPVALALLAVVSGLYSLSAIAREQMPVRGNHLVSWLLLIPAALLFYWSRDLGVAVFKNSGLLVLALAVCVFSQGYRVIAKVALTLTVSLLVLPFQEQLTLLCSYPLRLISTGLTVETLRLLGADISAHLTTIQVGETQIAITDACSGIGQLGAVFFLAYLLSFKLPMKSSWKIIWFCFSLPSVILANTIRLVITVSLFFLIGDRAFDNDIHIGLGYFFVVLSILLMWWSRLLVPAEKEG